MNSEDFASSKSSTRGQSPSDRFRSGPWASIATLELRVLSWKLQLKSDSTDISRRLSPAKLLYDRRTQILDPCVQCQSNRRPEAGKLIHFGGRIEFGASRPRLSHPPSEPDGCPKIHTAGRSQDPLTELASSPSSGGSPGNEPVSP